MKSIHFKVFTLFSVCILLIVYINLTRITSNIKFASFQSIQIFDELIQSNKTKLFNYLNRYPFYLNCKNSNLTKWNLDNKVLTNYSQIDEKTHRLRITRGLIIYFPAEKASEYLIEFKWLYRSWIEMQKSEPTFWRTDLIVFTQKSSNEFNKLNCSYKNKRSTDLDQPMCILIHYIPIQNRNITQINNGLITNDYLLNKLDIFNTNLTLLIPFYHAIKQNLKKYEYTDSILMAFEGYSYFKQAKYDFLIRSDMDVFLTPLFAKWIPHKCNDFYVGRGGYSDDFNRKRLRRIAKDLGLEYAGKDNLGSTWYSTPDQFRLVSYLTLFNMMYLTREEFSKPEIEGEVGTILWPYWHYGVLLLYGQHLGLNHLIATNQLNVIKLEEMLDYPSANMESIYNKIHIHVFHGDELFSKFAFKNGEYDKYAIPTDSNKLKQIKYYCLKMALEAKRLNITFLNQMLLKTILLKN